MNLRQIIKACGYRVSDGSAYGWQCYGSNARYMDFVDRDQQPYASVVFDIMDQTVYEISLSVPGYETQAFVWRDPAHEKKYLKECKKRGVDPNNAWDDVDYVAVDESTILEYARDIGDTYYDDLPVPPVDQKES
jgi:hypothetical protein